MRLDDLTFLSSLENLKRIYERAKGSIDLDKLAVDFIRYSSIARSKLTVTNPERYLLNAKELENYSNALKCLSIEPPKNDAKISITGDYGRLDSGAIILVSPKQTAAGHVSDSKSYLNPLLQEIFTKGLGKIMDFLMYEALFGRVIHKAGEVSLGEAHLFPDKFKEGPYTLEVTLETPENTISEFSKLKTILRIADEEPAPVLLDNEKIEEITDLALKLRKRLGALARYELPEQTSFSAKTNYCKVNVNDTELFYFYSSKKRQNAVVYFGERLFHQKFFPKNLSIINGNEGPLALQELVKLGFYTPSESILGQKINDLESIRENGIRKIGMDIVEETPEFTRLIRGLNNIKTYFETIPNKEFMTRRVMEMDPEFLEYVMIPENNEPILNHMLSRLSWNKTIRHYHDTRHFLKELDNADNETRKKMVCEVASSVLFRNQNNNEVNFVLSQEYASFCKEAGVEFEYSR